MRSRELGSKAFRALWANCTERERERAQHTMCSCTSREGDLETPARGSDEEYELGVCRDLSFLSALGLVDRRLDANHCRSMGSQAVPCATPCEAMVLSRPRRVFAAYFSRGYSMSSTLACFALSLRSRAQRIFHANLVVI